MTALHHASVAGVASIAAEIIRAGGRAGHQDHSGRAPLHWAAGFGFNDVARVLVEDGGARANVVDAEGWTPLHRCCQERPPEKKKEGDSGEDGGPLEEEDARRARTAAILLRAGGRADARDRHGQQTPLHLAAMNGYASTADVLLSEGNAEANAVNRISQTAVAYAVIEGHLQCLKVLLKYKPDLTLCDK